MSIKVEKGIPLPAAGSGVAKYPLADMEIGDSFFTPTEGKGNAMNRVATVSRLHKPKKFTHRTREENGVKGVRCWRIA